MAFLALGKHTRKERGSANQPNMDDARRGGGGGRGSEAVKEVVGRRDPSQVLHAAPVRGVGGLVHVLPHRRDVAHPHLHRPVGRRGGAEPVEVPGPASGDLRAGLPQSASGPEMRHTSFFGVTTGNNALGRKYANQLLAPRGPPTTPQ